MRRHLLGSGLKLLNIHMLVIEKFLCYSGIYVKDFKCLALCVMSLWSYPDSDFGFIKFSGDEKLLNIEIYGVDYYCASIDVIKEYFVIMNSLEKFLEISEKREEQARSMLYTCL